MDDLREFLKFNSQNNRPFMGTDYAFGVRYVRVVVARFCYTLTWFFQNIVDDSFFSSLIQAATKGIVLFALFSCTYDC